MGIELYPKFLSLTETRCYQPLCESIVAKCCQDEDRGCRLRSLAGYSNVEVVGVTRSRHWMYWHKAIEPAESHVQRENIPNAVKIHRRCQSCVVNLNT